MGTGIYKIINVTNNKRYVGSAIDITKRFKKHLYELEHKIHVNPHLQRAYDNDGSDSFELQILEEVEKSSLIEREQFYLDELKPEYNICQTAGSRLGHKFSPETCAKLSKALTGRKIPKKTRMKMSEARKGNRNTRGKHWTLSEETKRKMSESAKGRPKSERTKKRISKTLKEKWRQQHIYVNKESIDTGEL